MEPLLFRFFHMAGTLFWVGSLLAIAIAASMPGESRQETAASLRTASLFTTTPAMLVAFVGGFGMLLPNFTTLYAKAGWMHGKLALLLILAALTGLVTGKLRRLAGGRQDIATSTFRKLSIAIALVGILIVGLAVFRPGA